MPDVESSCQSSARCSSVIQSGNGLSGTACDTGSPQTSASSSYFACSKILSFLQFMQHLLNEFPCALVPADGPFHATFDCCWSMSSAKCCVTVSRCFSSTSMRSMNWQAGSASLRMRVSILRCGFLVRSLSCHLCLDFRLLLSCFLRQLLLCVGNR